MGELENRYLSNDGVFVMSGSQSILKLALLQKELDKRNGLNTAGFVSGYRGSPLGGVDVEFVKQKHITDAAGITFIPGVNEDLAAGMVQGTQNAGLVGDKLYDGTFAFWYAKGPGVDRAGDQLRHCNLFGTSATGGVVMFAGDDHPKKSSALPHETCSTLASWSIPSITPSGVEDILRLGINAVALSRYSGLWCSVKIVSNIADAYQSVDVNLDAWAPTIPEKEFDVSVRWPDDGDSQEARMIQQKFPAIEEFVKLNPFNEVTHKSKKGKIAVYAIGKNYVDLINAINVNGIDIEAYGIDIMKVGMSYPITQDLIDFAKDRDKIIVIEEKRGFVEDQLKAKLYDMGITTPLVGKSHFPQELDFDAVKITEVFNETVLRKAVKIPVASNITSEGRVPHFCSGCPHNVGTKLPEGSVGLAGVGCHIMVRGMQDRDHVSLSPMGGEGSMWCGQHLYDSAEHVFVNLGDGTYFHSGLLAIRQAVAVGANMTYKILYNDAVAMTGGQPVDGKLTVDMVVDQVLAEGIDINDVCIVSDKFTHAIRTEPLDSLMEVQEEFKHKKGVSVIIHEKQCATERRRKIKRGLQEGIDTKPFINPEICVGCGDCSTKSTCLSIVSLDTPLGTKRTIDYDNCNIDLSCLKGFCPSFMTVDGYVEQYDLKDRLSFDIPKPELDTNFKRYNVLLSGIGGTGIVSSSQMLAVAASLDGHKVSAIDSTGLAQKYGAVTSEISIGEHAMGQIYKGTANLIIGIDPQVVTNTTSVQLMGDHTNIVFNTNSSSSSELITNRDWKFDDTLSLDIAKSNSRTLAPIPVKKIVNKLLGSSITGTSFMYGYAYQMGWLPITEESMLKAIEINGAAVDDNQYAWHCGRAYAIDELRSEIDYHISEKQHTDDPFLYRYEILKKYKSVKYADEYKKLVQEAILIDKSLNRTEYSDVVMHNLFNVMAYKDEYEVARLWVDYYNTHKTDTMADLANVYLYLNMPWNRKNKKKSKVSGWWIINIFKLLQHGKVLRDTAFDPLMMSKSRQQEKELRDNTIAKIMKYNANLSNAEYDQVVSELSEIDELIKQTWG